MNNLCRGEISSKLDTPRIKERKALVRNALTEGRV